jgi:AcrR family transcriptional regulator
VSQPVPPAEPRWERRKDARPAELLEAAAAIFTERGFAAARLDDVAARAGVSKGTLYLYFSSKEELFKAVATWGIVPAIERAEAVLAGHAGSARELIESIVWAWWHEVFSKPLAGGLVKLMMAEARNFPELADFFYEQVISRSHNVVCDAIRRGIQAGEFRDVTPEYVQHVVMAPLVMQAMSNQSIEVCRREGLDPEGFVRAMLDLVLNGLVRERS